MPFTIETFTIGQFGTTRMEDEMMETIVNNTGDGRCEESSSPRRYPSLSYALCGLVTFSMMFGGFAGSVLATNLVPEGPEFEVSATADGHQKNPDVAIGGNGHSMAVWESPKVGGKRIVGALYGANGLPVTGEFQLGDAWDTNESPAVAMDDTGNALVVWMAKDADGIMFIAGQRFDHLGVAEGDSFIVTPPIPNPNTAQGSTDVAMDASGNALVVWSRQEPGSILDVYGQRYDSSGSPVGLEFLVKSDIGTSSRGVVTMDAAGNATVAWNRSGIPMAEDIFIQRYDQTGTPLGDPMVVDIIAPGQNQDHQAVAMDSSGNTVVVWEGWSDGDKTGIFGQRIDSTGMRVGSRFQVNTQTDGRQSRPAVDMDDDGNFVVAWHSPDSSYKGVFARLYQASGHPAGPEFQVNAFTLFGQEQPAVAMSGNLNAHIVWQSFHQGPALEWGIIGQRYTGNESPVCHVAQPQPAFLYSNNHAFNLINIDGVSDPDADAVTITVDEIYQDEPVNAPGSGGTGPDGKGVGTNAAEVRAEYVLGGNGRQYRINFTADDHRGGSCSDMAFVRVMNGKYDWDWIIYDSTVSPFVAIPTDQELEIPSQRRSLR